MRWARRTLRLCALAGLLATAGSLLLSSPAGAHSFLVSTTPSQGARLAAPPEAVVLDLSETVDPSSVELRVRSARGATVELAKVSLVGGGLAVRAPLAEELDDGIYVVAWQAFSDRDGHGTFGEFSFAVGSVRGALPAATSSSSSGPWPRVASWLFTAGFGLAAGSLAVSHLAGSGSTERRRWVRASLVLAIFGATLVWVERVGVGGGGSDAFVPATLTLALLLVALSTHAVARTPAAPLVVLLGAAAAWSARSHGASLEGVVGGAVDFVHLAAGGVWAGALGVVTVQLWRARRAGDAWVPAAARYSRVAFVLVAVLAIAGVVSSLLLVPTWADLWSTGYGRLLVVKISLFAVVAALAALGRFGGLRRRRLHLLRFTTSVEVAAVVAVLIVAGLLANEAPPAPASAVEALLGPPALEGALVRDAGLAGQLNVDVVTDGARLDIRVFSPSGAVPGTEIAMSVEDPGGGRADLLPRPCGSGCYTQELVLRRGTTSFAIDALAPGWTGGTFDAVLTWPPGPVVPDRLRQVIETTRAVPRLTVTEVVSSGPGSMSPESTFEMTGDALIDVEPYAGGNVTDVRALPGPQERLSLYVPGSQIFAVLVLDDQGRMVSSRLISPGHDIRRRFAYPASTSS